MPTLTLDMAKGAKIPVVAEVGQGRTHLVTGTTSERSALVEFGGMRRCFALVLALGLACRGIASPPPPPPPPPPLPVRSVFPADNAWNRDISADPADPKSDSLIARCGGSVSLHPDFGTVYGGAPWGIPFITVSGSQRGVPVSFAYADESDPGPYPIPAAAPIEGGSSASGDRHVLVVDVDNWRLYELFDAHPVSGVRHGRRVRARFSISPQTRCGRTAGRRPTPLGCRSSRAWCATMKSRRDESPTPCASPVPSRAARTFLPLATWRAPGPIRSFRRWGCACASNRAWMCQDFPPTCR